MSDEKKHAKLILIRSADNFWANSLEPDQARQNVGPDLYPNSLTLKVYLKIFFKKVDFEKKIQLSQTKKSMQN